MQAVADPDSMIQVLKVVKVVTVAAVAGWASVRMVQTEQTSWAITLLIGLVGVYAGPWLMALTPWSFGPFVGGVPLLPVFLSAIAVAAFMKLVGLGAAGPRR